jgi:signal peptidase II
MRWETRLPPPEDEALGLPEAPAASAPPAEAVAAVAAPGRARLSWWLTAAVIAADQVSKALVRAHLSVFDSRPLIDGLVDLVHVRNYGVAFGVLNDIDMPFKPWVTIALALAALAGILIYIRHVRADERLARVGLAMILGGALGNLIDRARFGFVVDFVDVYWGGWHFWAFNVADASITIGAILVFVDLLLVKRHASHSV